MEENKERFNLKGSFNLEELIGEMMCEIILLKAENSATKVMANIAMSAASPETAKSLIDEAYHQARAIAIEEIKVSHKWFDGYWKDCFQDILPHED